MVFFKKTSKIIPVIFFLLFAFSYQKINADTLQDKLADPFWAKALKEVYKSPEELVAQHKREIRKGLYYKKLIRGNPNVKEITLTFDDGPHPKYTPQILNILKKYKIKATFFVVGKMAEKYPQLIKDEYAEGHIIGNHTFHHVNLTKIPENLVETEWQACNEVIKSIIGIKMHFCRPPGGDYDNTVITAATNCALTTVLWTDDPGDYASPGAKIIEQRVLNNVNNGGIILLHDGIQQTIDILPQIIENLKKRGFLFKTVEEMNT